MAGLRKPRVVVVRDPAPAMPPPTSLCRVEVVSPNRGEAACLVGGAAEDPPAGVARRLLDAGFGAAVVKLGAAGAWFDDGVTAGAVASFPVAVADDASAIIRLGRCFDRRLDQLGRYGLACCREGNVSARRV